jgi:iron complex transport system permease protein
MRSIPVLASAVFLFLSLSICLFFGGTPIDFFVALFENSSESELTRQIFWQIRAPRVLSAAICGGLLASAGVLSQALFANPLASPSIIGTTSGGIAAVALAFLIVPEEMSQNYWLMPGFAMCGCILVTGLLLSIRSPSKEGLLLTGIALAAIFSALASLFIALASESAERIPVLLGWILGSIETRSWAEVSLSGVGLIFVFCASMIALIPKLEVLALGHDVAASLGVVVPRLTILTVIAIACFEGVSISLCGALSFVGLIVPHLTRMMVGPKLHQLFLCSMLNGASLVMLADLLARTLRAPAELPVGVIIALIGSPFFLLQLRQLSRQHEQL